VNLNVTSFDAAKHSAVSVVADAREALVALTGSLAGWRVEESYLAAYQEDQGAWNGEVDRAFHLGLQPHPAQTEVLGALQDVLEPSDVIVQAAGSLPGDLQLLWRTRDPKSYNVEYAYSCMGYEIAGGVGTKLADPSREVFVLVGDGSYLMMAQEIATAVAEGVKLTIVLVQNHGFASIGALSESVGSQRFGTSYRRRNPETGLLDGGVSPIDLAANAASLGADVIRTTTIEELREALAKARASDRTTLVEIETDPLGPVPSSESWWDVPVAETSELDTTRAARAAYEEHKTAQRGYLKPADPTDESTGKRYDA
jgi:3D-(3,5/4)-trihydroxycyclohexane-1,2-dione acylhydrolase (decyclizing)